MVFCQRNESTSPLTGRVNGIPELKLLEATPIDSTIKTSHLKKDNLFKG
jgi:hypothetical protein